MFPPRTCVCQNARRAVCTDAVTAQRQLEVRYLVQLRHASEHTQVNDISTYHMVRYRNCIILININSKLHEYHTKVLAQYAF